MVPPPPARVWCNIRFVLYFNHQKNFVLINAIVGLNISDNEHNYLLFCLLLLIFGLGLGILKLFA